MNTGVRVWLSDERLSCLAVHVTRFSVATEMTNEAELSALLRVGGASIRYVAAFLTCE